MPSAQDSEAILTIQVVGFTFRPAPPDQGGRGLVLHTTRGDVVGIYHPVPGAQEGVLWVWGVRGGVDGPANGCYRVLAQQLAHQHGIASLRLDYRHPGVFHECVLDALAGLTFLKGMGILRAALVGHSFGGAVVIAAAPFSDIAVCVVALSTQTYGAQGAGQVSPRPLLLVHGEADTHLPPTCSHRVYAWAKEPKELVLLPGAGHSLREAASALHTLLKDWLLRHLKAPPRASGGDSAPSLL
ncbi:MAG: alpha/beta hydrolase [Dehalococcoidia bacterium]|nr:alpha/beta hydrolase [Dehalococcoidia bacterium]MDW8119364.1 alpha/beta hydrolase [Chloroflexota bacterium]